VTTSGTAAYLSDAEQHFRAHARQLDLTAAASWLPGLDNMGFAAGVEVEGAGVPHDVLNLEPSSATPTQPQFVLLQ
jgi:hypothetical protein